MVLGIRVLQMGLKEKHCFLIFDTIFSFQRMVSERMVLPSAQRIAEDATECEDVHFEIEPI